MQGQAALVLSAGGARGAYQVGVIKAICEILGAKAGQSPFDIFCGVSAGTLNAAGMACYNDDIPKGVELMEGIWEGLTAEKVFKTDLKSIGGIGMKWMKDLSLGGVLGGTSPKSLLDTNPLRDLLKKNIPL
ncbi:MAG: patatin-like phospholipase family protein, partial [Bdellovibrionales bacterium]|nr:patatin-like phospholipase family protein [Bdellovibrionales bacterium]